MARIKGILPCCPIKNRQGSIRDISHDNELEHSSELREMVCVVIRLFCCRCFYKQQAVSNLEYHK